MDSASISREAIQDELEKICSSVTLGSSARLCRFLRYVVEQTLAGRGGDLKEYAIGIEVFDRAGSYDPNIDSIVRSSARRLRSKLKEYFESEGVRDDVLINLRAGSYIPLFRLRASLSLDLKADRAPRQDHDSPLLVAVLPFEAFGDDPQAETLASGLTEEITHRLSQLTGLGVVATRSASQFKCGDFTVIREMLAVDLVLEGTVRKDGSHLRIAAELANTIDGHQLWSRQMTCEMTELLQKQDEIASSIVAAVRPRSSQVRAFASKPPQIVLEAYSLYLRGRQLWSQQTPASLSAAIGCFEESIRKAPAYASSHAGLADCYLALTLQGVEAPKNGIPPAKSAALRAIELDDGLAEAMTSLANVRLLYDWEWEGAEALFQRAIQLGADSAAHLHYGLLLEAAGRFEEGMEHQHMAVRLDPFAAHPRLAMGAALVRQHRYDMALEHLKRALELTGNAAEVYCWLGLTYIRQQALEDAINCIHKARTLVGSNSALLSMAGYIYALAGQEAEANQVLNELVRLARTSYVSQVDRALVYLAVGERNASLDFLQQGYDERASGMIWLKVDPRFDPLRNDSRFVQLIEKMRFPGNCC